MRFAARAKRICGSLIFPKFDVMVPQSEVRTSCDSVRRRNLTRGSHVKGEDDVRRYGRRGLGVFLGLCHIKACRVDHVASHTYIL